MDNELRLVTVSEVAKVLRLHPETVRRQMRAGKIPYVVIGGVKRIRESDLVRMLEVQKPKKGERDDNNDDTV